MARHLLIAAGFAALLLVSACGSGGSPAEGEHSEAAADYERGPHRGRMLRDGDFAVEVTIFEDGVPPEYRVYAYQNNRPLPPGEVQLSITLTRLGGRTDQFAFAPQEDFLRGNAVVIEPHSFDVAVRAVHAGAAHDWAYQSYEGRTTIAAAQAEAAGIEVEQVGPGTLEETVALSGRVELQPQGRAEVTAWYPGRIVA